MRIREEKDMQNKSFRKGVIVGIIILFVGVSVLSSVSSKDVSVSNDMVVDDNERDNWKTNFYCIIIVNGDELSFCEPNPGLFFVRTVKYYGEIDYCKISGKNGTDVYYNRYLDLCVQYFFGYCKSFWDFWSSVADMRGFAIKCCYKVE
jgi:hypothetical protein